jgi:hypothetical protein
VSGEMRVAVFHSPGHDFAGALRRVKEAWPTARLIAWVPASYAAPEAVEALADEIRRADRDRFGARNVYPLLRQIRSERYDCFVVLFDSTRLRLFAALSGARERAWCPPLGSLGPLPNAPITVALREAALLVKGRAACAWIRLVVRILRVRPAKSADPTR